MFRWQTGVQAVDTWAVWLGEGKGGASMLMLLSDVLLFSCLAAFISGIVIAVASVLS